MTAKEFFKSTAFKCIAVLLSIVLICGILLTFCNALFAVSTDERTARAVAKVFPGEEVTYEENEVVAKYAETPAYSVEQSFTMTGTREGQYLLNIIGKGGYKSGTVTCWVLVSADAEAQIFEGVEKVVVTANTSQSFINKVGAEDIQAVIDKQENDSFVAYDTAGISTGATFSLGAIANTMNGAKSYVEAVYLGLVQPFDGYEYLDYINRTSTTVEVSGTDVVYNIVTNSNGMANPFTLSITVGSDKTIADFTIVTNGSTAGYDANMADVVTLFEGKTLEQLEAMTSDGTVSTGATLSNTLCLYSALFAAANYDAALAEFAQ